MMILKKEFYKVRQSSLARNAGWVMAGQGLGFVLQAAYFVLLARLLGTKEYGIYAGAFALAAIASPYSTMGSGTLFMRYVSNDVKLFSLYWANVLVATSVVSIALIVVLHVVAKHFLDPASAAIVVLCAIGNCFCGQLTTACGQVFQTFEKLRITASLNLLTNFMRFLAAGAMLLLFHHATAYQWAIASVTMSVIAALTAVIAVTLMYGCPRLRLQLFAARAIEGCGHAFANSTSSAYNDLDKAMLSHYGMNIANGIYTMAYRIVDIATIPIVSIRDAAMPRFFREGASGIAHAARLGYKLLPRAIVLALLATVAMAVSAPLIPHIVGHGFAESVSALRWLCLLPLFRSVHQMAGSALTGAGLQRYRTGTQVVASALNLGLNIILIPQYGWLGAAWGSLATDGALAVMNWGILSWLCRSARQQAGARMLESLQGTQEGD